MTGDEYRTAMNALAREAKMPEASAARVEQKLLSALARRATSGASGPNGLKRATWGPAASGPRVMVSWRRWLPAVAAIVLLACVLLLWRFNRPTVTVERWAAPPPASAKARDMQLPAPRAPQVVAIPPALSPHPVSHAAVPKPSPPVVAVQPSGFVELPWSAGLPAFESGEIVRMEVPVASLPAYGIDISPGVGTRPLEADLLIGQDGFARAIRLVTNTARSAQ